MVVWYLLLALLLPVVSLSFDCRLQGSSVFKSLANEDYVLSIDGNPQTYMPTHKYNVSINAKNGATFTSFIISITNENSGVAEDVGMFEIADFTELRFSSRCPNMLENSNANLKNHIEVTWVAPKSTANGCILLRAAVAQHRDIWYMDDGWLAKKLCEEQVDDIETQPPTLNLCCACDEAKYELTFEGKWSRHTHPKDFPANNWRTFFSDIIGASHTIDYRFWNYGQLASHGLKELAEHGSTRALESELKNQSDQIRTIIKARGISFPNITGKTFAVFRVDSKHHLISLVSMIHPSPDWIVGVSGLELCLPNCSWIDYKMHNLYPWDTGTDSGPSYMSADQPQIPPDVIRRIKPNFPNDPRSPFFDPSGAPMKPLATLHINRRRLYEKSCPNTNSHKNYCATTMWSNWSTCSNQCGSGKQYRTRNFKNPPETHPSKCNIILHEERDCNENKCKMDESNTYYTSSEDLKVDRPECAISDWSEWSSCSSTCGTGVQTRTRQYLNPRAKKKCQRGVKTKLTDLQVCFGTQCDGNIDHVDENANDNQTPAFSSSSLQSLSHKLDDYIPAECGVSQWSEFSPCMGPCGTRGQRIRRRKVWNYGQVFGIVSPLSKKANPCSEIKQTEIVDCINAPCDTVIPSYCFESIKSSHCRDSDVANYWFYDHISDQCGIFSTDHCDTNRNKFSSKESCEETCQQPRHRFEENMSELVLQKLRQDCMVSDWAPINCSQPCNRASSLNVRQILRSPKYGGKHCPKHLIRFVKCDLYCNKLTEP